jgi:hypothetical protein
MPTVYVEGLGNISFPDSMSPQQIEEEINRYVSDENFWVGQNKKPPAAPAAPEMGGLEAFGRGALQSVKDIGYGLQQVGAEAGSAVGLVEPSTVQRLRQEEERRRIENAPFMESGAGKAGYIAGSIGSLLVPGAALARVPGMVGTGARALTAPTTFRAAATGGGLLGAAQPVAEEESRAAGAIMGALGGTVGQAVGRGVSRIAQPVTSTTTPQVTRAAQRLEQAGVPVDIAGRMGSENLRAVRRFFTDNPISASVMKKGAEKTQSAFNTAALRLIGEQGEAALPEVLARADDRIGAVMDGIAKNNRIKVDDRMVSELAALEEAASMTLEPEKIVPLRNQLNNILSKVGDDDSISGDAYQRIRTIAADMGRNPALATVAQQLRETIDSALERSAGPDAAAAIKQARKQYRNLKLLEPAVAANATGNILPAALASSTSTGRQRGAALYGRGDADMARLARSMQTMAETLPQSGTAPRAAIQTMGTAALAAPGIVHGIASGENERSTEEMMQTAALFGLGALGARRGARLYQSPAIQQYLMRGIQSPLARRAMMSRGTRGIATYAPAAGLLSSED